MICLLKKIKKYLTFIVEGSIDVLLEPYFELFLGFILKLYQFWYDPFCVYTPTKLVVTGMILTLIVLGFIIKYLNYRIKF